MKNLMTAMFMVLAVSAHAQSLEADLDGNASALQASEMRPAQKPARPTAQEAARRQSPRS
jgi:hypothetical protein